MPHGIVADVSADEDVEREQRDREDERGPAWDHAEDDERGLENRDPECETRSVVAKPPAAATRLVLDDQHHASTVPGRCCEPRPAAPPQASPRGVGRRPMVEEPVHRRPGPADVGAKGPECTQLVGDRRRGEVVRRQRREVARTSDCGEHVEERCAARVVAVPALALVEVVVHRAGRGLRRAVRQNEQDEVVLGQIERGQGCPVFPAELWAAGEEEGHVRAECVGKVVQTIAGKRLVQGRVREQQRGRCVGAAAAEPRRDGDALRDVRTPPGSHAGLDRKRRECRPDEGVLREALDGEAVAECQLDTVREREPLQDGHDLVLAIRARRPDDEREVQLRGGRGACHSARVSSTNSCGSSASARTPGSRPIRSSAAAASSRVASPDSSSEFGSVLRRCANAALTTLLTLRKSSGSTVRRNATSAESTFGRGRNTVRATGWNPVRSAASWTSTETAPYAFVPGEAKKRSATSRWTITVHRPTLGSPSRLSATIGVATLYGRFATSLVGAGSSVAGSRRSASAKRSSTFGLSASASRSLGSSERSSSTACTWATRFAR